MRRCVRCREGAGLPPSHPTASNKLLGLTARLHGVRLQHLAVLNESKRGEQRGNQKKGGVPLGSSFPRLTIVKVFPGDFVLSSKMYKQLVVGRKHHDATTAFRGIGASMRLSHKCSI